MRTTFFINIISLIFITSCNEINLSPEIAESIRPIAQSENKPLTIQSSENTNTEKSNFPGVPTTVDNMIFDSSFNLKLSPAEGDDSVTFRYKLDGTAPQNCEHGIYAEQSTEIEILLNDTTIKAIACDASGNASEVMTRNYIFTGTLAWAIEVTTPIDSDNINISLLNPLNLEIEWGDGNSNIYTDTGLKEATHTYVTAGVYTLKIKGYTEHIKFDHIDTRGLITRILSIVQGISGITSFERTFYHVSNLTGSIPENLFVNNPNVTSFKQTFSNASGLTGSIPENLFANNPNVTNFGATFEYASGLTGAIPRNLFINNSNVTAFTWTFLLASGLSGQIPSELFANNPNVTNFVGVFSGAYGLNGNIPKNLFANNPLVDNFSYVFNGLSNLSGSIPEDLFINNTMATKFNRTFDNATGLTGNAPDLWNQFPAASSIKTFGNLTLLDNYASIPAAWK